MSLNGKNFNEEKETFKVTKSLTIPVLTTTERNNLSLKKGLIIYNLTTNKLNVYTGSSWEAISSS